MLAMCDRSESVTPRRFSSPATGLWYSYREMLACLGAHHDKAPLILGSSSDDMATPLAQRFKTLPARRPLIAFSC